MKYCKCDCCNKFKKDYRTFSSKMRFWGIKEKELKAELEFYKSKLKEIANG